MTPIRTALTTVVFTSKHGGIDLPACRHDGMVTTFWQPSREDLAAIAAGVPIKLTIFGEGHPHIALEVEAL